MSNGATVVGSEMVRRGAGGTVEINKGIADVVFERMMDGTEALVPDGALVERHPVVVVEGIRAVAEEERREGEKKRENEGFEGGGDDATQEKECLH